MGRIYGRGIQPKLSKGIGVLFIQISLEAAEFPLCQGVAVAGNRAAREGNTLASLTEACFLDGDLNLEQLDAASHICPGGGRIRIEPDA